MATIPVWITEHDDDEVSYVVNELDDMRGNWEDMCEELEEDGFDVTFEDYLDTWTHLEMPEEIFTAEYPERNAWIDAQLDAQASGQLSIIQAVLRQHTGN